MAQDVRVVADKLVRFLGVIMDPQADPLQREEAYKGTHPVIMEQEYIKDALSHIVVEMMKQEWQQQWPCLQELYRICSLGETQIELVLLVLLHLAEDIVILQNVQNHYRRLEMHQTLTSSLKDLFPFFLCTLNNQYAQYTLHVCFCILLTYCLVSAVLLIHVCL